jgi:hypothetical protein
VLSVFLCIKHLFFICFWWFKKKMNCIGKVFSKECIALVCDQYLFSHKEGKGVPKFKL